MLVKFDQAHRHDHIEIDYFAVSLMAGQKVRIQATAGAAFSLINPDGQAVIGAAGTGDFTSAAAEWTTDRPGAWRLLMTGGAYTVVLRVVASDTYGLNIGLGGVHATRHIFDGTGSGTSLSAHADPSRRSRSSAVRTGGLRRSPWRTT